MLAMALYPDAMRKAQLEIDVVIGGASPYVCRRSLSAGYGQGGSEMATCYTFRLVFWC